VPWDSILDSIRDYVRDSVEKSIEEKNLHISDSPHLDIEHHVEGRPSGGIGDPGTERHYAVVTVRVPLDRDVGGGRN
jgi:hypothetical protein